MDRAGHRQSPDLLTAGTASTSAGPGPAAHRGSGPGLAERGQDGGTPPWAPPAGPPAGRGLPWPPAARSVAASPVARHTALLLCYLAAGAAATWPRARYLTGRLPSQRDSASYVWGFWWVARQATKLSNPWFTGHMAAPVGIDLGFHSLMPLPGDPPESPHIAGRVALGGQAARQVRGPGPGGGHARGQVAEQQGGVLGYRAGGDGPGGGRPRQAAPGGQARGRCPRRRPAVLAPFGQTRPAAAVRGRAWICGRAGGVGSQQVRRLTAARPVHRLTPSKELPARAPRLAGPPEGAQGVARPYTRALSDDSATQC